MLASLQQYRLVTLYEAQLNLCSRHERTREEDSGIWKAEARKPIWTKQRWERAIIERAAERETAAWGQYRQQRWWHTSWYLRQWLQATQAQPVRLVSTACSGFSQMQADDNETEWCVETLWSADDNKTYESWVLWSKRAWWGWCQ